MDMFEKIKNNIKKRVDQYSDSRQLTSDEVRISWLVFEVEQLRKSLGISNNPRESAT